MIAAVIDLGTNTSNLVVAELIGKKLRILFEGKEYVRLGDKKITENLISDEAAERALGVISRQLQTAREWNAEKIRIIATSAVREAGNRDAFTRTVHEKSGIMPEVIDGDREARLIYLGVRLAMGSLEKPSAILDIGGGSNEIIICENGSIHWQGSYPAGMSRIINSFPISDPITQTEVETLERHFISMHTEAIESCRRHNVDTLIGCSGAFNTLADIIDQVNPEELFRPAKAITRDQFSQVYERIVASTHEDRQLMKGMDPVRTDLIVPALILCRTFIEHASLTSIIQTGYALREGVLYEMVNGEAFPRQ